MPRNSSGERPDVRFVELSVCFQNIKSGSGPLVVDPYGSVLEYMASGLENDHIFQPVEATGWLEPRLVHVYRASASPSLNDSLLNGITLNPFDFCVVSLHFLCTTDDVYETDFLARAVNLRTPVYRTKR